MQLLESMFTQNFKYLAKMLVINVPITITKIPIKKEWENIFENVKNGCYLCGEGYG